MIKLHHALASLCVVIGLLALTATPALAAPPITFGASQINEASGVAVDDSTEPLDPSVGDVYVADGNHRRIDKFGPAGTFLSDFGESSGVFLAIAVDNSTNPLDSSKGDLYASKYAGEGSYLIEKFSPVGGLVLIMGKEINKVKVAQFNEPGDPHGVTEAEENLCTGASLSPTVGTGDLTKSSKTIDSVVAVSGTFAVGQPIAGNGIPSGTTISAVGSGTLTLSAAAEATASLVELTAYTCGASTPGTGPGEFSDGFPEANVASLPVAVDALGNVWVGDVHRLEEFSPEGVFESEVKLPGVAVVRLLAIDTDPLSPSFGDFYLSDGGRTRDESQKITAPASGSYTLTFEGQTTAALPFNATPAEIQGALAALSTIGAGNVSARSSEGEGLVLQFEGALAHTNLPLVTASAGSVTMQEEGVSGHLLKVKPDGTPVATLDEAGHPSAIGLDPATGDLFLVDSPAEREHTFLEYGPSGVELESFGSGEVLGTAGTPSGDALAFGDAAQDLYVVSNEAAQIFTLPPAGPLLRGGSLSASPIRTTTATLGGTLEPEGAETKYHFQYLTEVAYRENVEKGHPGFEGATQTPEATVPPDFAEHPVSTALTGLKPETAYRFCLLAKNSNGNGTATCSAEDEASFTTLPPAVISGESVSGVNSASAALSAEIDPLGIAGEYRFEYITEAAYQHAVELGEEPFAGCGTPASPSCLTTPEAGLAPVEAAVSVEQRIEGLQPHAAYRYRVLADNHCNPAETAEVCTAKGPALAFTTQRAGLVGEGTLPDGRAWELVSPPNKHGAGILPLNGEEPSAVQAAAGGGAVTYLATSPTELGPAGNANLTQVLSARGPDGWVTRDPGVPHDAPSGLSGLGQEYKVFSSDLSVGLLQPFGAFDPGVSSEASEQTAFLHSDFEGGSSSEPCTSGCYRPVVTGASGFANVPEGVEFGVAVSGGVRCPPEVVCGPQVMGVTPDLRHMVMLSPVGLNGGSQSGGLFEWSEGVLQPVSVPPGSGASESKSGVVLGGSAAGFSGGVTSAVMSRHAISSDGTLVVWSEDARESNSPEVLYLRDMTSERTVRLDVPTAGVTPGGAGSPVFQDASVDDSRVFFTDREKLTVDSGASVNDPDLYECRISVVEGEPVCALSDLTPETNGEPADVQAGSGGTGTGAIAGVSEDGSSVYFVADGVLTGAGESLHGERAVNGQPNLYVSHEGVTSLIAVLSPQDRSDWANGEHLAPLQNLTVRVSPDGRWLAFLSTRSLTGYDNEQAKSGECEHNGEARECREVYLYHLPSSAGEAGSLVCASCDPSGGRPTGPSSVPDWVSPFYQPRYLSNGGRLFFDSSDALVQQDVNGAQDVYEYEPPQSAGGPAGDTCTSGSSTFSAVSGGCVNLISSGASPLGSSFLDASENGEDVFFLTNAQLSLRDTDTAVDVYDARVGGAEPEPVKPVECQGDACQGSVAPPNDPTPGSLTFNGPTNLTPAVAPPPAKKKVTKKVVKCKKGFTKNKKGKCVKKSKKKAKAKKSTNHKGSN